MMNINYGNYVFRGFRQNSDDHIYFITGKDNNQVESNYDAIMNNRNNAKFLFLLDGSFVTEILKYIPRQFTITTKSGSSEFNIDILKDTSSVIADFLKENPNTMKYHIDIDDNENILNKFEKLYQGEKIIFDEDDLPVSKKITKALNILNCPNYMKPENLKTKSTENNRSNLSDGVEISKFHLNQFLTKNIFQQFKIVTKQNEYMCNIFGIYSSKVIRDLLHKDPTLDHYEYDFNDEYGEFQPICKLFNFQRISITSNNMDVLKEIAEDLQINEILPKIEKNINEYEKMSKIIDEKQSIIDSIEELFGWLYDIQNLTIQTVKKSIVESNWSKTEENVLELAAYLIQVIKSDFKLHSYLIDLIIQLDKEANESNNLEILLPFISKQIMLYFGENLQVNSFIYNLYKREIINQESLYNAIKETVPIRQNNNNYVSFFNIENIHVWFLPEIIELNLFDKMLFTENIPNHYQSRIKSNNINIIKFINYYYPNKIDLYKKMRDNGQPSDEITIALRNDDVDSLQSLLSRTDSDLSEAKVPFNIFEGYVSNGQTTYINYAAAYGSIKCFKYLLLNHSSIDEYSFRNAVFGGNIEIIKIVDQKSSEIDNQNNDPEQALFKSVHMDLTRNNIYPTILKHQNDLFDWILEQKYSGKNSNENQLLRLLYHSIENGNAHSFIEIIDKCANSSYNIKELIQMSARNGFYRLAKLILDIMNEKSAEFKDDDNSKNNNNNATVKQQSSIQKLEFVVNNEVVLLDSTFVLFGNLSIFKIGLKFDNSQEQLEKSLSYCIDREFTSIFDYYFDELIKNDFKLTNSFVLRSINKSLYKQDPYYFNHLIEKIKIINPNFFYGFNSLSNILKVACGAKNIEYVKTILEIAKEYDIKPNITTSFIEAALKESKEICQYIVDEKLPIDYQQILAEINTVGKFNSDIFSILLNNANPGIKYVLLADTLTPAIKNKNKNLVELLLNQKEPNDDSLIKAVLIDDLDIVNIILDHNNKPSFVNNKSNEGTALFIAADKNYVNIVERLLLVKGIDPSLYERNDKTPLISSIVNLNLKIMNLILDFYGDEIKNQVWQLNKAIKMIFEMISSNPNEEQAKNNNTQIIKTATTITQVKKQPINKIDQEQILPIIRRILKIEKIDPNSHGGDFTLLSFACENNDIEMIKTLLKNENVDVNSYAPTSGNTPLMIAIKNKNTEIAELFITDKRTNINAKNYHNKTALIMAVENNLIKIVELILENEKFDPDESCLNYAFMISTGPISKRLITEKSLDVNYNYPKNIQPTSNKNDNNNSTIFGNANRNRLFANNQNNNNNQINNPNNIPNQIRLGNKTFISKTNTDVSQISYNFETPLTYAVKVNIEEKVDLIIQCPKFDKSKSQIEKCIFDSLKNNNDKIFDKLLPLIDNDVNICDFSNKTLLHSAIRNQSDKNVTKILNNDKFDSKKNDFLNAFISSYQYRHFGNNTDNSPTIMKSILEYDKNHDHLIDLTKLLPNGYSFYTVIKSPGNVRKVVDFLLENGADPNMPDIHGFYPLEYAIYVESREFVSALLDSGKIDLKKNIPVKDESIIGRYKNKFNKNRSGFYPGNEGGKKSQKQFIPTKSKYESYLHLAAKSKNGILDLFLTDESLDVNVEDDQGDTPFIDACRAMNLDNIRLLFNKENIDYNHCNKNGEDALKILNCSAEKPKNKDELKNKLCSIFGISTAAFDSATNNAGPFGGFGRGNGQNWGANLPNTWGRPNNNNNNTNNNTNTGGWTTMKNNNTNTNTGGWIKMKNNNTNNPFRRSADNNDNNETEKTPVDENASSLDPGNKSELSDQGSAPKKTDFSFRKRARAKTISFGSKKALNIQKEAKSDSNNENSETKESDQEPQTLKEKEVTIEKLKDESNSEIQTLKEETDKPKEESLASKGESNEEIQIMKEESHEEPQNLNEEEIEKPKEELNEEKIEKPKEELNEEEIEKPKEELNEEKIEKSKEELNEETTEKPKEELNEEEIEKPKEELNEEEIEKPKEELNEETIEKPKEELNEETIEKPKEELNEETIEKPKEELNEEEIEKPKEELNEETIEKPKEESNEEPQASVKRDLQNPEENSENNESKPTQITHEEDHQQFIELSKSLSERINLLANSSDSSTNIDTALTSIDDFLVFNQLVDSYSQVKNSLTKAKDEALNFINNNKGLISLPVLNPEKSSNNNNKEEENLDSDDEDEELISIKKEVKSLEQKNQQIDEKIAIEKKTKSTASPTRPILAPLRNSEAESGTFAIKEPQNKQTVNSPTKASPRLIQRRIKNLKKKSEDGDPKAQYQLGAIYSLGEGVQQDQSAAFNYYKLAADQGDKNAQFMVASSYSYGRGTEVDKSMALQYYIKSAEQGYVKARFAVGHFYEYGQGGVELDHEKAIEWYRKAAKQGHKGAINSLQHFAEEI